MEQVSVNVKGVKLMMMPVQGGNFTMGANALRDTEAWENEKPAHSVSLKNYYIGETVVTQALWQSIMGLEPGSADEMPVVGKSWAECQNFIDKLNNATGRHFRLPTEAEWENAASGGNLSGGYKYAGSNDLNEVAWYDLNSGGRVHPVKLKKPNELGLYDMTGNVWEWCSDFYAPYSDQAQSNPTGPSSGTTRVCRGSSCRYYDRSCRITCRMSMEPQGKDYSSVGFRLVLDESDALAILEENRAAEIAAQQESKQEPQQPPVMDDSDWYASPYSNPYMDQKARPYSSPNTNPYLRPDSNPKAYSTPNKNSYSTPVSKPYSNQNTRPYSTSNTSPKPSYAVEAIDGVTYNKNGIGMIILSIILTCSLIFAVIAIGVDIALFSNVYIKGVKYPKYCKTARTIGAISLALLGIALVIVLIVLANDAM